MGWTSKGLSAPFRTGKGIPGGGEQEETPALKLFSDSKEKIHGRLEYSKLIQRRPAPY